jgi:hypothetical protein
VTTIEGLAADASHPLLRVWVEEQVPQCGYCQPGQIMQAAALLAENPHPNAAQVEGVMSSVLCRCGTYLRIRRPILRTPVPLGWWRSVYNTQNGFVNESFMDEVAAAAGADPYEFRRRLLPEDSRLRRALDRAAREAGWGRAAERGRARGLACHPSFGSFAAEVVDVAVDASGHVRVHNVVCAIDAGPSSIRTRSRPRSRAAWRSRSPRSWVARSRSTGDGCSSPTSTPIRCSR